MTRTEAQALLAELRADLQSACEVSDCERIQRDIFFYEQLLPALPEDEAEA